MQPTNQVDVSSELSGTVRSVFVDYNSPVKVGQVLAELDTDKLKATLSSSRARLASVKAKVLDAEATLVEKKIVYERKRALAANRVSSQQDIDTAKAAYDRAVAAVESAKADVGVAEADVEINDTNLVKSRIVSPINGVVLKRNVDPGQTVASSLQAPILFTIAEDLKQMEVQVDVDEADVGKVKEGQQATFSVDAYPGPEISGAYPRAALRLGGRAGRRNLQSGPLDRQFGSSVAARNDGDGGDHRAAGDQGVDGSQRCSSILSRTRQASEQNTSLLRVNSGILRGRPPFRPASQREESGPNRRVWILKNGVPVPVAVVVGVSDGRRTEILKGEIKEGQSVIVDARRRKHVGPGVPCRRRRITPPP